MMADLLTRHDLHQDAQEKQWNYLGSDSIGFTVVEFRFCMGD
jgi:hypothetical protein